MVFIGIDMSLNDIQSGLAKSRRNKFLSLWLMLACMFASCQIHASQIIEPISSSTEAMNDSHDCCDEQVQCCEEQQAVAFAINLDCPTAILTSYDSGLGRLFSYLAKSSFSPVQSNVLSTGPPVYLRNCRFTL